MSILIQSTASPSVLSALVAATAAHPYERKLLVCRRMGIGRELLRSLAARGHSWINWEVTTPRSLALQLVAAELSVEGTGVADEFDELALLDASIDAVLDGARGRLAELAEGTGLRQAVAGSVRALRMAGIGATHLERARFRDEDKRAQIARILDEYEARLRASGRVDTAAVYKRVNASLPVGDVRMPDGLVFLMPDHTRRGLQGHFLDILIERGATVLPDEPVFGIARPDWWLPQRALVADDALRAGATPMSWLHDVSGWSRAARTFTPDVPAADDVVLDVFAATSVSAELREVLRRAAAAGLQWDEVEIVATDTELYGVALDGLAQRLGVPVSHAVGLPMARTRPGRAVAKYLEWVELGYPADMLRQMLERGDIAAADTEVSGVAVARRLRALKIGRGRDRYDPVLSARQRVLELPQTLEDERTPEEFAEERKRDRDELAALVSVVRPLIAASPELPDRIGLREARLAASDLARGLLQLLSLVPITTLVDRTAVKRLRERLVRIEATATRRTTLRGAIAMLASKLEDRVPAPEAEGASPWTSSGGHLHLSDLEHGGFAGRKATFIVGLDAARFPGGGGNDALLVDDDRRRLTTGQALPSLPTAGERIDERRYAFAALVARLRGRITFSYPTWDAVEGRAITPASELLQAYRLLSGDATADYESMHEWVKPAASSVPRGSAALDADDVWLNALSNNGVLRRGVDAVCASYPGLQAGVNAWKARRRSDAGTVYHGAILPRPELDPRDNPTRVVSPTQLQVLGTCAHRYLLRYVLRVKKPDDPELSSERWLSALEKGSLLHAVYEQSMKAAHADQLDINGDAFETRVIGILDGEVEKLRAQLPPPGQSVFDLEYDSLREDARAFVVMVREDRETRTFLNFEYSFGRGFGGAANDPVEIALPDGSSIRLNGAIDRIDSLEDGRLVVVDYKTGGTYDYGIKSGPYNGGRRLQHILYAKAAERLFGASVARFEYHFPSRKAENHRAKYELSELADGLAVVTDLLDLVANGWFLPTNQSDDCKFCDYAAACRVVVDPYGKITSPMSDWSREGSGAALDLMRRLRR